MDRNTYYLLWQPGDCFQRVAMTDSELADLVARFASRFDDWRIAEVLVGVEQGATPYDEFLRQHEFDVEAA